MGLLTFIVLLMGGIFITPYIKEGLHTVINRRKMYTFHYVEYFFLGEYFTTRENGALNDLAGVGLLQEIETRGGKVFYHRTGTEQQIENIIDFRYLQQKSEGLQYESTK